MPTFTTPLYDSQAVGRANIARLAAPNIASGTVEFAVIPYVQVGTEAAADIINLCVLPAGCIPVPQLCRATINGSPGTAFTFKVGTAADDDGFATAVALTSAARDLPFVNAGAAQPAFIAPTPIVADTGSGNAIVFATVSTATAPGTGTIYFTLAYKRGR